MPLKTVHRDPTGQVVLYQAEDRYHQFLEKRFGRRFLDYRRRWRETSERGDPGLYPLNLDLALNTGCQLSCLMCPLPGLEESRRVRLMRPELFQRLMDQARDHELPALTLGLGSEPLLHPSAADWIRLAGRAGIMDIRLGTNGLMLKEELIEALVDGPLTRLEVSVDAARPASYREIRGGRLDLLERAVDLFLETRARAGAEAPLLRLSFLKLEQNRGELEEFLARWRGRADLISIQEPIWFPGSRLPRPENPGRPLAPGCAQPWQRLAVHHDGRLQPCCSWYGRDLFSPSEAGSDPAAFWRSPAMAELRSRLSASAADIPAACRPCRF